MAESRLASHGLAYLAGRAAQVLAYVAVMPLVTHQLDAASYGTVAVALVVFQAVAAIAPLGLTSVVAWSIYEREPEAAHRAQRLLIATTLIAFCIVVLADLTGPLWSQLFSGLTYEGPLELAVWLALPVTVHAATLTIFQAQHRPGSFVACTLLVTAGGQGLGLALLATRHTPEAYLAGVLIGAVVGAVVGLILVPLRTVRPASIGRVVASIRHGGPTVIHLLGFLVLALADRVLVERILGLEAAARYQVAYVVGSVGSVILYGLNNAWSPSVYEDEDDGRWTVLVRTSVPVARLMACTVAAVALAAPVGVRLLAPASYGTEGLAEVSTLVAAATMFDLVYLTSVMVLFKRKRTAALWVVMPVAAVVNVGLNVVLLDSWGLAGAGVATVAGYAVMAAMSVVAARRVAVVPWDRPALVSAVLPAVLGIGAGLLLPTTPLFLILRLAVVAVIGVAVANGVRRQLRPPPAVCPATSTPAAAV